MTQEFAKEHPLLVEYNRQFEKYAQDFPTQKIGLSLRRMSKATTIPAGVRKQPYLKMLVEICKELQLNELEIALWAILVDIVGWDLRNFTSDLLFAAFSAKTYMNEQVEIFKYHISLKAPNFYDEYKRWIAEHEKDFKITLKALNLKYVTLCTPTPREDSVVDYNYYVDEILEVTPTVINREAFRLPEVLNFNSIFEPINEFYVEGEEFI